MPAPPIPPPPKTSAGADRGRRAELAPPAYKLGDAVATREAYGTALVKLGEVDPRVVALDADVKNSTFSDKFEKVFPDRFYQNFIAEQVMVGVGDGAGQPRRASPFPSTFACFLTRGYDFIRMAAISDLNIKLAGSHAGVSIGEDGPSQMALEDLAMMRARAERHGALPVRRGQHRAADRRDRVPRGARPTCGPRGPKTPVIYGPDETFPIGGCKVLRPSAQRRGDGRRRRRHGVRGAEGVRRAEAGGDRRSA